jgi:hypothetical protein
MTSHPFDTTARTAVEHERAGTAYDPGAVGYELVGRDPAPRRTGSYIRTFSGGKFWPHDPRAEDVRIVDIAHSLSRKNRYGGHIRQEHYSVAEHCVIGARWLRLQAGRSDAIALAFLLHDSPEFGGIGDVSSPAKKGMPEYKRVEQAIWLAIAEAFDLPVVVPAIIHEVDERMTADEMMQTMHGKEPYMQFLPLGVTLNFWPPERAKAEFLALFEELYGEE